MFELGHIDFPDFSTKGAPPCSQSDPEAFFPQENEVNGVLISSNYTNESGAKSVCRSCPYVAECLAYALENRVMGIWGGTTDGERIAMKRRLNRRSQFGVK